MNIYKKIILENYNNPKNFGKLSKFTNSYTAENTLCGDEITVYLKINKSKIEKISFEATGCAISIASASLLFELAKGKSLSYIKNLKSDNVKRLLNIELGPSRLKCALLPLEALQKAILNP